jgi:hypothetical protein
VLFGLLQQNKTLRHIEYSLVDEENITKLENFKKMVSEGISTMGIT